MTKIYFDDKGLTRSVNSGLSNSIDNLNNALEVANSLNIPNDFDYGYYLYSLDSDIQKNVDSLVAVYNLIKNSKKFFSNIEKEMETEIKGIENYSISLRQSAIK